MSNVLLYKTPCVVVDESITFKGLEERLQLQGVKVEELPDLACIYLMRDYIMAKPELWNEDIGE